MKDIIFVYQNYFEDRDYDRFGIEIFSRNGIRVTVWSMIYLLSPIKKINPIQSLTNRIEVYYPQSMDDVKKKIAREATKEFLLLLNYNDIPMFRRELYKHKVRYYELKINPALCYGEEYRRKNLLGKIKLKTNLEHMSLANMILSAIRQLLKLDINHFVYEADTLFHLPRAVFCSTEGDTLREPFVERRCKHYFLHTLDYDNYLQLRNQKKECDRDYIVFVDDGDCTLHPDITLFRSTPIQQSEYAYRLSKINDFLDKVETLFQGIEIVVAGHPRVRYNGNEFGSRRIVQFETAKLVKESKFVIISMSTAWSYVVLYNKPVLFFKHPNPSYDRDIAVIEQFMEREPFDLREAGNQNKLYHAVQKLEKSVWKKYMKGYIKGKDSKDQYFFESVARILSTDSGGKKKVVIKQRKLGGEKA